MSGIILKRFGWTPVGKYDLDTALVDTQTINPLPCNFERTVKMISKWDVGGINLRINNDAGGNYSYSEQSHGRIATANSNTQNSFQVPTEIALLLGDMNNCLIKTVLQKMGNYLRIISHGFGFTDTDNFLITETGGIYRQAGPYIRMDFIQPAANDIVGQVEFFESVYGF